MLTPLGRSLNVLMTGGTGRIGAEVGKALTAAGHTVTHVKRGQAPPESAPDKGTVYIKDLSKASIQEWQEMMKQRSISVVLNLAAQSTGEFRSMVAVNATMPKTIAEACGELGIPMVHTCSHSAELQGLDPQKHPYATTKRNGAQALLKEDYGAPVVIARLGAVLGGQSDVPVCSDAAVSKWSPFIMLPSGEGGEQVFHPVDEETVINALQKIVETVADPAKKDTLPQVVNLAGQEVSMKDFLHMVNPSAIGSIKLPDRVLNLLAKIVNQGVFTREFVNMSKLIQASPMEHPDTTAMEALGVPVPSPQKVAEAAGRQLSLARTSSTVSKAFFAHLSKGVQKSLPQGTWPSNFLTVVRTVSFLLFGERKNNPLKSKS